MCQDGQTRWRLLADSTVRDIHYDDLKRWAGYRLVNEDMKRRLALEISQYHRLTNELDEQVESCDRAMKSLRSQIDGLNNVANEHRREALMYRERADKARGWATVGKVFTIAAVCTAAAFIYREARP